MAMIDSNNFITHLIWNGLIDKATCGELKKAIELCTVKDVFTKADMVAMLTELQMEIEELEPLASDSVGFDMCVSMSSDVIQQKINLLKEAD